MLDVMSALSFKYAAAGNMGGGKNGKKSRRPNKFIENRSAEGANCLNGRNDLLTYTYVRTH